MQHQSTLAKLLVAAAVAGAFAAPAMAQTSVNVEGIVDVYAGSMKNSGDTGRISAVNSGGMSTSYIGFKGAEDLGGGLKANFTLGAFFRPDTGQGGRFGPTGADTLFARDANVGLSGNFGAVTLGRSISPVTLPVFLFNPLGDSFTFSPLVLHEAVPTNAWAATYAASDTGWSNTVRYTTKSFNGLTADLYYQFGEQASNASKKNFGGNLLYFNGPLSLTAAYHDVKVGNPVDNTATPSAMLTVGNVKAFEQKLWLLGAAYDFNIVKVYATYNQAKHDIDLKDKTAMLGLSVPTGGAGKVLAEIAQTRRTSSAFSEQRRTTYTIGYDYNLSKRTDAYAMLMNDKVSGNDSAASAGVGVRHKF
ncbi:porin [Noviherbaspirillum pedocola]|uniref:Porin n=1 Tax=Noviherbaspirillum pedocola TaxID=2801341 RepID=A0A934W5F2_9BURK|nr:porin [Noviherbaspirillum pedocola]MBK4733153.1 porin [Noviherbaspirillum pedocola]